MSVDITKDALAEHLRRDRLLPREAPVVITDQIALDAILTGDAVPVELKASPEWFSEKAFWDEALDAGPTKHDPKNGQFTAGEGSGGGGSAVTKLAGHAEAEAHVKELKRAKAKGLVHSGLGRIPKGSDIAHAQSEVNKRTLIDPKTLNSSYAKKP